MSFLLSLLTFLFLTIVTFFKKSFHYSFLCFTTFTHNRTVLESPRYHHHHHRNIPSPLHGLGFSSLSGDVSQPGTTPKRDPGGIGFLDDVGGSVNGLMSCTESLGFESSDERRVDDGIEDVREENDLIRTRSKVQKSRWKRTAAKSREKKFPPPLSSMTHNGKPNFFLRPVRKDGRLELTEVKIHRPEILRASRQNGRLRLHLIKDEAKEVEVKNEAADEIKELNVGESSKEKLEVVVEEEEEEEEERVGERWFPAATGGRDGFRRCNELMSHHHQNLHAWSSSQHFLTIS